MRLSQAWLIARHDMGLFRHRRSILYALVAFPFLVAVGFPLLVRYLVGRTAAAHASTYLPGILDAFTFWFVIAGAILPTAIASYGIIGEKIERSLEPLLSTPTTDGEILLGKVLASFLPTVLAVWASSVVFMALIDRFTQGPLGYLYFPNTEIVVILLVLTPLASLYAIEFSVLVSSRVTDVRTAQQYAGLVFVPLIFLYFLGEVGDFPLNTTNLLYVAAGLAAVVLGLFVLSRRIFHREDILTRWR